MTKRFFLFVQTTEYPDRFTASPFASVTVTVVVKVAPWSMNIFEILAIHTVSFFSIYKENVLELSYSKNPANLS